ncbi:MAG: HRDC domain-containing protein [Acidimicrobiales bacterium]
MTDDEAVEQPTAPGDVTWVGTPGGLDDLIRTLVDQPLWAFDTEFHREKTYYPQLALLQVAWPGHIALVDPLAVDVAPFAKVLAAPGTAVAHAADQDLEVLDRACARPPSRLFDTQLAAGFLGMSTPSLSSLVERELGMRLPKADRLTDWSRRPLSPGQKQYAAADVAHLLELHRRLCGKLAERGRLGWAEEECALLLTRPRGPQDPDTAWWRLKDTRSLRGASRGVAQEVAAWRERRAATLDIPPRFVLADLALLGIAHKPPRTEADLLAIRGLDARSLKPAVREALLEAVERGRQLPAVEVRAPLTDDNDRDLRAATTLAGAWVAQLGRDLEIDPALLATRTELTSLLHGRSAGRLDQGWRSDLVGKPVRLLAAGGASIAFDGRGGLLVEERSYRPLAATTPSGDRR